MAAINKIIDATNNMTGGGFGSYGMTYGRPSPPPPPPQPLKYDCPGGDIRYNKYVGNIVNCQNWVLRNNDANGDHPDGADAFSWNGKTCIAKYRSNVSYNKCKQDNEWQYYEKDYSGNFVEKHA